MQIMGLEPQADVRWTKLMIALWGKCLFLEHCELKNVGIIRASKQRLADEYQIKKESEINIQTNILQTHTHTHKEL